MADEKQPDAESHVLLVILFGAVFGVVFWLLAEHDEQATELLNIGIGKVKTWVL